MTEWKATEDFVILTGSIAVVLGRANPLRIGTQPQAEEYDIEAGQIARLLLAGEPNPDVASVVDRVFTHYGIAPLSPEAQSDLQEAISAEYDAIRQGE